MIEGAGTPPFVGRSREIEWLEETVSFRRGWNRPVFVVGVAGVGKTALVRHWIEPSTSRTSRRPWARYEREHWLDLSSIAGPETAMASFLRALYESTSSDEVRLQETIVVVDGIDGLSDRSIEDTVSRLFNLKRVRGVVFIGRRRPTIERAEILEVTGLREGEVKEMLRRLAPGLSPKDLEMAVAATHGFPLAVELLVRLLAAPAVATAVGDLLAQPLYDVAGVVSLPEPQIITAVAPRIVTVTEGLLEQLRKEPEGIHALSPRRFEEVLAELLTSMGMRVELTPPTRDGGKDILAFLDTEIGEVLCLVEAKRYRPDRKVGVDLVRSLYGTLCDHQANSAMLVTTSSFTADAREFQRKHKYQLSLKDYADVSEWIRRYRSSRDR